ncbi:tRNA (adenosine(37)-N6)-threonylcarbamoyltransferase complex dimerization subunit type 1 TsaB [Cellulomonas biazotea]|uniref:tRNA (Adenosine(37)-N6)-threonylcarbamoyltransferase complex dimerization subunit type 1 TsaB n=1 Tax=Cellulomonas biazotea TaxID=1709 RepID=A0A402DVE3_9CELL|nr:tRNA (adenosine(37)-N6)-threonylcarbamoyltransferase complex dimerization subunit type 1 TsaB [Cellulomonas biazotea]GCE78078.1 tRNA (adenosine(37)-N6)-threonylcarbamoyltransferase complex dimerization subunit type 1 TsaB [Cellulomonas biazotea]
MPVLALDTSAAVAVALLDDSGVVLAARSDDQPRHHAELLAPMVADVLADAGVDRTALTSVVVGTGPAPFTGLRVGLVTARTLALGLGVPARGVPSVDALAAAASRVVEPGTTVLVATDARRREVYWSLYRVGGAGVLDVLVEPQVGAPDDVAADDRVAGALVVGRGALLHPVLGGHDLDADALGLVDPDPAELALLAAARAARGEDLPTTPLYLRRPDAVPSAARKRVLG